MRPANVLPSAYRKKLGVTRKIKYIWPILIAEVIIFIGIFVAPMETKLASSSLLLDSEFERWQQLQKAKNIDVEKINEIDNLKNKSELIEQTYNALLKNRAVTRSIIETAARIIPPGIKINSIRVSNIEEETQQLNKIIYLGNAEKISDITAFISYLESEFGKDNVTHRIEQVEKEYTFEVSVRLKETDKNS